MAIKHAAGHIGTRSHQVTEGNMSVCAPACSRAFVA